MANLILDEAVIMPIFDEGENALTICGIFKRNAKAQGVSSEDIKEVLTEARSGDYEHLKAIITANAMLV